MPVHAFSGAQFTTPSDRHTNHLKGARLLQFQVPLWDAFTNALTNSTPLAACGTTLRAVLVSSSKSKPRFLPSLMRIRPLLNTLSSNPHPYGSFPTPIDDKTNMSGILDLDIDLGYIQCNEPCYAAAGTTSTRPFLSFSLDATAHQPQVLDGDDVNRNWFGYRSTLSQNACLL